MYNLSRESQSDLILDFTRPLSHTSKGQLKIHQQIMDHGDTELDDLLDSKVNKEIKLIIDALQDFSITPETNKIATTAEDSDLLKDLAKEMESLLKETDPETTENEQTKFFMKELSETMSSLLQPTAENFEEKIEKMMNHLKDSEASVNVQI